MKLRVKFKFHGPPFELLHHFEASYELDYRIKAESFNLSLLIEIWKALWMSITSDELISICGIGEEKR